MKINFDNEIYIYGGSLQHHGIDGQKWGVKNGPPYPLDGSKPKQKESRRQKRKKYKELKKRDKELKEKIANRKYLTDDEIDELIDRFAREKKLNDLYLANTPKSYDIEKSKNVTKNVLGDIGASVFKNVAKTMLTGALLYTIGTAVASKNKNLAKSMVTGKPKGFGGNDNKDD